MKHTIFPITPAALVAALALGVWAPAGAAAQAADPQPNQAELQKKLDEARAQLDRSAREVAELSMQLGGSEGRRDFFFQSGPGGMGGPGGPPPRAVIGVQIANGAGEGGAKVIEVSPGGAAANAGIKAGDVITSIGGEDISKDSDPGRALVSRMSQVDPNLKLQVGVLRDGKKMNFDVTPRPAPAQVFRLERRGAAGPGGATGMPPMPGMPGMGGMREERRIIINRGDEGPRGMEGSRGMRFRGIEFATLSEKLGGYFGVKSGVLVVRAGDNPAFKLQDGDVILAIDGRAPSDAQHAGRILRSYSAGEKLSIRVQRDRRAQNLEVTVPGGDED